MKRTIAVLCLAGVGFYLIWPAVSLVQIRSALEQHDADLLTAKSDLGALARSLAEALPEVPTGAAEALSRPQAAIALHAALLEQPASPLAALVAALVRDSPGGRLIPTAGEAHALAPPATAPPGRTSASPVRTLSPDEASARAERTRQAPAAPASPVRTLTAEEAAAKQARRAAGSSGRVPPPMPAVTSAATPTAAAGSSVPSPSPRVRLENVRGVRLTGPARLAIALAREPGAAGPDLVAELSFTGYDWRLTSLRETPR